LTFTPVVIARSSGGVSAQPKSVRCWPTSWIVLPEPVPGLTSRSIPSALKMPFLMP
jgi:hypothetical protein